ncbi:TetR/AcrR family transcriptional regulator C-terminal domain-containing protein [Nocardia sp. NPDC051911]|uniref:TetR/AcrR family transcriptional regulator C-terminal domain-containing protein n=1 Tax=Nocardia sp. NPDC051911 TaxID=3154648 RepID=UPI00342BE6C5
MPAPRPPPSAGYGSASRRAAGSPVPVSGLSAEIVIPEPDPATWRSQLLDVFTQIRDRYLEYPGVSRAALAMVPTNLEALRGREGMFASLLAGGIEPRIAAWTLDTLSLYVSAYALEQSLVQHRRKYPDQEYVVSRAELVRRFTALPADTFPQARRYAAELISGTEPDRFAFTLCLIMNNLSPSA